MNDLQPTTAFILVNPKGRPILSSCRPYRKDVIRWIDEMGSMSYEQYRKKGWRIVKATLCAKAQESEG